MKYEKKIGSIPNLKVLQCSNNPFSEHYPFETLIEYFRDKFDNADKLIRVKHCTQKAFLRSKTPKKMTLRKIVSDPEIQSLVTDEKIAQNHQVCEVLSHLKVEIQRQSDQIEREK